MRRHSVAMRRRTVTARRYVGAGLTIVATAALIGFVPGIAAAAPTDVFISEYIEGSSNNKALEIFNGTGAPIDPLPADINSTWPSTAILCR